MTIPDDLIKDCLLDQLATEKLSYAIDAEKLLLILSVHQYTQRQHVYEPDYLTSFVSADILIDQGFSEVRLDQAMSFVNGVTHCLRGMTGKKMSSKPLEDAVVRTDEIIGDLLISEKTNTLTFYCVPVIQIHKQLAEIIQRKTVLVRKYDLTLTKNALFFIDQPEIQLPLNEKRNKILLMLLTQKYMKRDAIAKKLNVKAKDPEMAVKRYIQELNNGFKNVFGDEKERLVVATQGQGHHINSVFDIIVSSDNNLID